MCVLLIKVPIRKSLETYLMILVIYGDIEQNIDKREDTIENIYAFLIHFLQLKLIHVYITLR